MQWTDGNGTPYGEDPYGGYGYAYAYGHQGDTAVTDTATLSWDPAQLEQWTYPVAEPDHLTATAWDAPHGDVLTAPPPEPDTAPRPVPEPDLPEKEPVRPVFVDSSGRRQRRVLRAARLLVIPAGGYVALLISTLLGGPSVSSPFVPQPDSAHRATPRVSAPDSPSRTGHHSAEGAGSATHESSLPTAQNTSGPTGGPGASSAPAAASGTTTTATRTTSPAPASTYDPTLKGRAVGSSHKPVK
ncbi:hypothetical protein [Streptomyces sp. NK08204]|uniref:hypothetical protein n=1 Tax=Streptomyces sp. NK08204 TaxID=2873260 RepID=UPI001CEDFE63|nr:hypothetical protein [Streptomyces sp. NK08204]